MLQRNLPSGSWIVALAESVESKGSVGVVLTKVISTEWSPSYTESSIGMMLMQASETGPVEISDEVLATLKSSVAVEVR